MHIHLQDPMFEFGCAISLAPVLMPYGIINETFRKYEMLYESITDLIFIASIKTWHIMLIIVYLNLFGTLVGTLSYNLVVSTSWNPQGLSGPVMGLLYLYLTLGGTLCTYFMEHSPS
jgi:hypothetical protein